jgi:hypothetical protein
MGCAAEFPWAGKKATTAKSPNQQDKQDPILVQVAQEGEEAEPNAS